MQRANQKGGFLLLEDGECFPGEHYLGSEASLGEAVFNTSHSGYQEILSDPSYCRQIMVFTTPHIGNVGVNDHDQESDKVQVAGTVVRHLTWQPSNWRALTPLNQWLAQAGTPILIGADTRAITRHLRQRGAMRAGLFPAKVSKNQALEQILASPSMEGADLASQVTCLKPYTFSPSDLTDPWHPRRELGSGLHVAVLDFGVKKNICRELACRGCRVTVLPASTKADQILAGSYHGILLSNGPGDPAAVAFGAQTIKALIGKLPLFGICLGHQLLSLSAGFRTFKLPFGHRGANHPVRRNQDNTVEITSQNHGFAVEPEPCAKGWGISHINLNDGTVEGLEHEELPIFSIQYHPEASPGPHEGQTYFDRFIQSMKD